jgi:hypothetical protein
VPEEPEYAPEYSREERVKHALLAFGIALVVIFGCNVLLFPRLLMLVNHVECQTVFGIQGVAVVMFMVFVGVPLAIAVSVGAFLVPRALAAIGARQYPAPGRKVNGKVRIRRGRAALPPACFDLACIALLVVTAIWGSFQAAAISAQAAQTHMDCVRVPEHPAAPAPPR